MFCYKESYIKNEILFTNNEAYIWQGGNKGVTYLYLIIFIF